MASRRAKSDVRAVARGKDGEAGLRKSTGKNVLRFLLTEANIKLLKILRGS